MKIWKIICLILSIGLLSGGWLGYSYYSLQTRFDEKISAKDWKSSENILEEYEKTTACWLAKNVPRIKQELAFEKSWLLAQRGAYEEAIKELRKAANISLPLKNDSIYNAATLALVEGRESLERLAEDYIKVLGKNPNDFQAKVNLEIIRILQQQAKMQMPAGSRGENGQKQKAKIKKYRPGDQDRQGTPSSEEQGVRY